MTNRKNPLQELKELLESKGVQFIGPGEEACTGCAAEDKHPLDDVYKVLTSINSTFEPSGREELPSLEDFATKEIINELSGILDQIGSDSEDANLRVSVRGKGAHILVKFLQEHVHKVAGLLKEVNPSLDIHVAANTSISID